MKENKSLLISTPTYASKSYCEYDFLNGLLSLEVPEGWDIDFLILENTVDVMDTRYFKSLIETAKSMGIQNMTIAHVGINNTFIDPQRLTIVYNHIRGYHNTLGFTRVYNVESDVIHHDKNDLMKLMKVMDENPDAGIVTGVTEYEQKPLMPEEIKELEQNGVMVLDVKYEYNTMIYKKLSMDETKLVHAVEPLAIWLPPDKTDWVNIEIPIMNKYGYIIEHDMYSHDEIKAMKEPFEVVGCPLGCALIRGTVLTNIPFRYNPFLGVFNDVLFPIDVRKAGWKIFCEPTVWPEHRARAHK